MASDVVVNGSEREVSDIEPVLQLLEIQNPSDNATWQTRYVLLSIIVIIPLNISRLDSFKPEDPGNESRKTVMERYVCVL
ncbi:Tubulin-specific chaperone D [Zootermopsis nevadensis]|uniref:Tubulin-specific chaperone D n=1 Tax=Zootermopsis nevadensis TaxID=136037 RepID=A0A067R939_ZOONE|nr:Tubulin-specific chaperone D [Zootermopsis nevadensis]